MTLTLIFHKQIKLLIVFLFISTNAFASIGSVNQLKGEGQIDRNEGDKGISLEEDLDVFSYDTVKTGNGRVGIEFIDDTKVELTEHSKLIIDDFVYDPNTKTGKLGLKATLGSVRYASGQIAKNSSLNVKISTPTATIAVRGTDFAMVIDELGGSTILLLPSCDTAGMCYVGEIEVSSDAGFVILNEAFQATRVETSEYKPFKPVKVDIDESMISNLLILSPPKEISEIDARADREAIGDLLDLDFLEIDVLNEDLLSTQEEDNFDELDVDYLQQDFLADVLDQINAVLAKSFLSELTNVFVRKGTRAGQDEETGIIIIDLGTRWEFTRESPNHYTKLKLSKRSEYIINLEQSDFIIQDFIVGDGGGINRVDIIQK
jgi:hypothetical protein